MEGLHTVPPLPIAPIRNDLFRRRRLGFYLSCFDAVVRFGNFVDPFLNQHKSACVRQISEMPAPPDRLICHPDGIVPTLRYLLDAHFR